MRAASSRACRGLLLILALLALLLPRAAQAGKRSMIPPGQEQRIRELVDQALSAARSANELPVAVDERSPITIDRDRIRVILHAPEPDTEPLPRLLIFHPNAVAPEAGDALAPGVTLECGAIGFPSPCPAAIARGWAPVAARLAEARDPWVETIWQIEESGVQSRESAPPRRALAAVWIDRGAAIAALLLGLGLIGFARRHRCASDPPGVSKTELALLLGLLGLFVAASASATQLLPLHEHNSFIARSDCAIDERCVSDPAGAWSMTTLHGYGLLLELIPYRVGAVARLSLAMSVIMLVLVWALARRLATELGQPARAAGLGAVAVLVSNPVFWRLSGAATFWPWALCWTLAAALAGIWAAQRSASEDRRERVAGAAAWVLATISLAFASASNIVCLTLGAGLVIAPMCWSRASSGSAALRRAAWLGPVAIAGFALLVAPDYLDGIARAFGPTGIDETLTAERVINDFNPLLLDPRIVTPVWPLACLAALLLSLWLRIRSGSTDPASTPKSRRGCGDETNGRKAGQEVGVPGVALPRLGAGPATVPPSKLLTPLVYAYLLPAAFLGTWAGDLVGSGYPVGFINHHWELAFTSIAVGLALASLLRSLEQLRVRRAWLVPTVLAIAALLLAPLAREGWRMATGERVLERELVALEHSFASLPEHDLLVVAPRMLDPLTEATTRWDPLEVVFPVGFYEHALRERGLEPGLVVSSNQLPPTRPGERILLYVGSSLRSFQPHEIAAGVVPDPLERPELVQLRNDWALETVHEFAIRTEQHEAISQRLGADRRGEVELGFYWLRPHVTTLRSPPPR